MKVPLAVLLLTLALAATAAVFAIWPVVADAPWESGTTKVTQQAGDTDEIRCKAALDLRQAVIQAGRYQYEGNADGLRDYPAQLARAVREIAKYC